MRLQSLNPYTEELNAEFDVLTPQDVDREVGRAREAFSAWRGLAVSERSALVKNLATHLRGHKEQFAGTITREMGKPIRESRAEIEKCAWLCDYYAESATALLEPECVRTDYRKACVVFQPLGIVLSIMPWNFPFWQPLRFAIPALCAGNVCVLKHASNVPLSALAIQDAFRQSGFPPGVFSTLLIDAGTAMDLIGRDLVDAVSLTGSNTAGAQVGARAGEKIKKLVLELGGSDPFVVLSDADLEAAAVTAVKARMMNAGQSCIAAKRFIVMDTVVAQFTRRFIEEMRNLRIGDPMDERTDVGPVARKEFIGTLQDQVEEARGSGAEIVQVDPRAEKGFFFPPTAVLQARPKMRVLTEEVFGPVAPIIAVSSDDEAIALANASEYGLGASLWTRDLRKAEALARRLDAGFVAVNDMVKSDPRLPFGGIKKSGVGRELSQYGLKEFTNIKTVVIKG
jgi:succinate-semialdehyde dehydrogenase/glutarate-semialdehyde dehydrogenase